MKDKNSQKKKILLAEDDASMRRFIEIALQRAGYQVVSAEDGLAAMKFAVAEKFDAVVTDAVMPNLTGHDLCRILRENPSFKNVPLIVLSGLEQDITTDVERDCANVYLLKSTNLKDELIAYLSKFTA